MEWIVILALALAAIVILLRSANRSLVYVGEIGLLYRKGQFVRELEPGHHWHFDPFNDVQVERILLLPSALSPHQYEVISSDQFAFRVTVTPLYTIKDARYFHENTPQIAGELANYKPGPEARFTRLSPIMAEGVMTAVAAKTLEEFIANPAEALAPVAATLGEALPGAELDRLAITSVTLPPEVRKMFTEVERARREGLAGLERAKAEQASLRALANAARNMAGNPELAQLKMLQIMESAKGAKTFVLGNPPEAAGSVMPPKG